MLKIRLQHAQCLTSFLLLSQFGCLRTAAHLHKTDQIKIASVPLSEEYLHFHKSNVFFFFVRLCAQQSLKRFQSVHDGYDSHNLKQHGSNKVSCEDPFSQTIVHLCFLRNAYASCLPDKCWLKSTQQMITNPSFLPLELRFQTSYHISSSYSCKHFAFNIFR